MSELLNLPYLGARGLEQPPERLPRRREVGLAGTCGEERAPS